MRRVVRLAVVAVFAVLLAGCPNTFVSEPGTDGDVLLSSQEGPGSQPDSGMEVPQTADGGSAAYHALFLPPLADPAYPDDLVVAEITPFVRFTTHSGEHIAYLTVDDDRSERVRRESDAKHGDYWITVFHPRFYGLEAGTRISIEVVVGEIVAGSIDVELVRNGADKRRVDAERFVPIVVASAIPVKFRVLTADEPAIPDPPVTPDPPTIIGIDPDSDNPVLHPASRAYQLLLRYEGSQTVFYRTVEPLPEWITLDEASGEVVVSSVGARLPERETLDAIVRFYASVNGDAADDPAGGSSVDTPFTATFTVERGEIGSL